MEKFGYMWFSIDVRPNLANLCVKMSDFYCFAHVQFLMRVPDIFREIRKKRVVSLEKDSK